MKIYVHARRTYTVPSLKLNHHTNLTAAQTLLSNIT